MTAIVMTGDARALPFPDDSIDLIVTSPPYFNLRRYAPASDERPAIGEEATPQEFIAALIECTREMARVLKPSGSIFVNLGDKYGPGKGLRLLPERYRIACADELGLIPRAVVVWSKPNGLPEPVRDRVRRSHEDWVHLTKSLRYFEAVDEIREPDAALPGSVWSIPTQPLRVPDGLAVNHFAAFPMELPRRLITGWCPREVCAECGDGRRPVAEGAWYFQEPNEDMARRALAKAHALGISAEEVATVYGREAIGHGADRSRGDHQTARDRDRVDSDALAHRLGSASYARQLRGRTKRAPSGHACACPDTAALATPGLVLDPFGGTGTTALVADVLGRDGISYDASADYARIAQWRTTDPKQRARAARGLTMQPAPAPSSDANDAGLTLFDSDGAA